MERLLSPKDLATAIGVSESSVKRWADDGLIHATRTAGGHRRIALAEALRYLRESGIEIVAPQVLGLPAWTRPSRSALDLQAAALELGHFLRQGAKAEARGLLFSLYLGGFHLAQIADGPLRSAMSELGQLWHQQGDDGIFLEHRATQIVLQIVQELRSLQVEPAVAPVAVGGGTAGDPYRLPSVLVATVLTAEGFRAVDLGPETPISTLKRAIAAYSPRLVWLSVTSVPRPKALAKELRQLLAELAEAEIALAVGGREVDRLELPRRPRLCIGRSMTELVAFVSGLRAGWPAT
jgi:MerR family transcriptional regulator, light-induced transcriptional regulator